jgi:hypothetical protein
MVAVVNHAVLVSGHAKAGVFLVPPRVGTSGANLLAGALGLPMF